MAICSKLSVSLEVRSKIKKKKHWSENVSDENCSNYKTEDLEKGKNILPVHMVSVSVIASKMSAEGFNSPSWIILVLSSQELLHWKCMEIVTLNKDKNTDLGKKGALYGIFYVR